ncbi:MAG: hypothetical protein CMJ39_07155 [Phycisphaerae bacterium]|nr:hypothetical protein [Phycisphaerae bacterium]
MVSAPLTSEVDLNFPKQTLLEGVGNRLGNRFLNLMSTVGIRLPSIYTRLHGSDRIHQGRRLVFLKLHAGCHILNINHDLIYEIMVAIQRERLPVTLKLIERSTKPIKTSCEWLIDELMQVLGYHLFRINRTESSSRLSHSRLTEVVRLRCNDGMIMTPPDS